MTVYVDNIGTIFMSNNVTTSSRTRHIRTQFVRDLVDNGVVEIVCVPSGQNGADILTKNVTSDLQARHSKILINHHPILVPVEI